MRKNLAIKFGDLCLENGNRGRIAVITFPKIEGLLPDQYNGLNRGTLASWVSRPNPEDRINRKQ